MAEYFGIDFGTTNSAVVLIEGVNGQQVGEAQKIGDIKFKRYPFPSYVAINRETGDIRTGVAAKKSISDTREYEIFKSIKTVIDENKSWDIAGKTWSPVDIAAEMFKALKKNAEERADGHVELKSAVVAVLAGFSPEKKYCIRKAAHIAGIKVSMFVTEPTAAYCSKRDEMKKYNNVAVFDWGGGTLDVVVLRIHGNRVIEYAKDGMSYAGNDIDKRLAEKICLRIAEKKNLDISFDSLEKESQLMLLDMCEEAKIELSDDDKVQLLSAIPIKELGMINESIDYDTFATLIEDEVQWAIDKLLTVLSDAGMNRDTIDCVIFEGGSSRLRPLQKKILEYFDKEKLIFSRTAMWDIAHGAANIAFNPGCHTLSKPIGIIQSNNRFYPLLNTGQHIPTKEKQVTFGITEYGDEARFVFSDGEDIDTQTFTEYFPVKLRGFSGEVLQVSFYVDPDTVFRMKIHSSRMPDDVYRVWTYSDLKVSYDFDAPKPEINLLAEE